MIWYVLCQIQDIYCHEIWVWRGKACVKHAPWLRWKPAAKGMVKSDWVNGVNSRSCLLMPWLPASPGVMSGTVETPYNTAPYITGSNIARLGHGSQNSWSKLWIPIVKSAPVRVIFTWKSVPKKSIHGSSDIYLRTQIQWKQAVARLPVVLPFRCHCHLPLLWHNKHYMTPWSSIHGQEGLIDANCICLRFTGRWAHRHRHPVDSCLEARWTRSVLPK